VKEITNIGLQYVQKSYFYEEETVIFLRIILYEYVQNNNIVFNIITFFREPIFLSSTAFIMVDSFLSVSAL
jgi:hypothetical protein